MNDPVTLISLPSLVLVGSADFHRSSATPRAWLTRDARRGSGSVGAVLRTAWPRLSNYGPVIVGCPTEKQTFSDHRKEATGHLIPKLAACEKHPNTVTVEGRQVQRSLRKGCSASLHQCVIRGHLQVYRASKGCAKGGDMRVFTILLGIL
ncbi:hypothetical protein E2C01_041576 [Portunus trituberculatus]|uniref:Uncharacterized protein n=1 Tax=Portunus trituberculatus TaxID=210409 RepID=A0A5B7FRB0_PORTR|nr:hypothetical protein [Portunus trituberculatus]